MNNKNETFLTLEEENAIFSNSYSMNLEENQPLDKHIFLNEVCSNCEME